MAIAFVGAGPQAAGTTSPLTVTLPAHSAGDALLLFVWTRNSGDMHTVAATGYVPIFVNFTGSDQGLVVLAKIAGASESNPSVSYNLPLNGWCAQALAYSGVDASFVAQGGPVRNAPATVTQFAGPRFVAPVDGMMAVSFAATTDDNNLALLGGSEQGFTARMSGASYASTAGNDMSVGVADKLMTSAGDVQTAPTWNQTQLGADAFMMASIGLFPDGGTAVAPYMVQASPMFSSASGTSLTSFTYVGMEADDLVIVVNLAEATGLTFTPPAGFAELDSVAGTGLAYAAFYVVTDGTDTSPAMTASSATTNGWSVYTLVFRNVDPATPFDVTAVPSTSASAATFTPTGVTTVTDNALAVSLVGFQTNLGIFTSTTGWVMGLGDRMYSTLAGNDNAQGAAMLVDTTAGALTFPTWEHEIGADSSWAGISTALRPGATVPAAPANPAAAALSSTSIRVTWDDVADETGYRVERSPDGLGSWADVSGNLAAGTVSYDDTGLTASTQYFYRVIAFNAVGDSSPSSTVNATTSAASGNRMGGTGAIRKPPRYSR